MARIINREDPSMPKTTQGNTTVCAEAVFAALEKAIN